MGSKMKSKMPQNMSQADETKVVQTELPAELYDRFKEAADARGLTIKEAAAEAITEFTYRYQPIDPDDPLFAPLSWDDDAVVPDDDASERVDEIAYGGLDDGS